MSIKSPEGLVKRKKLGVKILNTSTFSCAQHDNFKNVICSPFRPFFVPFQDKICTTDNLFKN